MRRVTNSASTRVISRGPKQNQGTFTTLNSYQFAWKCFFCLCVSLTLIFREDQSLLSFSGILHIQVEQARQGSCSIFAVECLSKTCFAGYAMMPVKRNEFSEKAMTILTFDKVKHVKMKRLSLKWLQLS